MRNKLILFLMLALLGSSAFLRADEVTYNFDDGTMQGWTSIDADGDTYGWEMGSAPVSYLVPGASLAGTGHNSSADMVISGSYSNNVGVLTPNNFLVSPAKGGYSGISFWACGQDASYVAEHFGVVVSTGGATANEFTVVQEWTMTAKGSGVQSIGRNGQTRAQGSWHEYTVDLSAYNGQDIWVAIRHFNCSDMFILDVDDITLLSGGSIPTPPPGPTPPTPVGNELTVYDGTVTNNHVPMYVFYFDDFTRSQYVIPATDLESIAGTTISALRYYTTSTNIPYTTVSTVEFYITEVGYTTITEYIPVSDAQVVYTGTVDFTAAEGGGEAVITFDTPYQYNGGNLLIGCDNLTDAGYKNISFYGQTVQGASISGSNGTSSASAPASAQNFIPKTTLVFEGDLPTPPTPPTPTGEFSITPSEEFALGDRPTNGWMEPFSVRIYNGAATATISASMSNTSGQNPFLMEEINNLVVETGDAFDFNVEINPSAEPNNYSEEFTMFYSIGGREIKTIPVTGNIYTAETPDIVEMAGVVEWTNNAYTNTPNQDAIHANYRLFGMDEMKKDVVYEFTLDDDYTINVHGGDDFVAIFNKEADFHPTAADEPVLMGAQGVIANKILLAGEYYLIIASDNITTVEITRSEFPAPTELTYVDPSPADGAMNVEAPITLAWEGGDNATQYQVLFGTQYPPQQPVVDWTMIDENYGSYTVENLVASTQYFWQINVKNSKGIVNGEVWGFTSTMTAPHSVTATPTEIFTDESTLIKWKFSGGGQTGFTGEITVADGTAVSSYIPVYGLWVDDFTRSEMIYPAEMLEEMQGGEITSLTYYIETPATAAWAPASFNVYMMEVEATTLSSYYGSADAEIVYSGSLDGTGTLMTINLTTPYVYEGGNLLVGIEEPVEGTYKSCYFYGIAAPGASASGYSSSSLSAVAFNQRDFLPKTTFVCGGRGYQPVANRSFKGFNVYYGDVKANDELLTEKQFELSNLPYNMEGHDINVTAVYDEGESVHSTPEVLVYVSGYGNLTGTVTEMITGAPVAGANVKFSGKDEFNNTVVFQGVTDDNGVYTINDAKAGTYMGVATFDGMEPAFVEGITLAYNTTETVDFTMHEVYVPVGTVIAEEIDPSLSRARWTMGTVPGGSGSGDTFFVDFETGIPAGWTTIDADGDSYNWMLASVGMGTGYGHNGSSDMILSQSYNNNVGALNPDNYLVTPQVTVGNGSTFNFYACAQDNAWASEHFGVAVSTTTATASAFTMVQEWTMTAKASGVTAPGRDGQMRTQGTWYQYTVDLSDYAGQQIYIAIRHFNCSDWFYLDVDDIELAAAKNRSVDNYAVYRKAILKENGVTEADSVCFNYNGDVYTPITDTLYNDADWANMEPGLYQYGVSAIYPTLNGEKGNRAEIVYDFENGQIPSDFVNTSSYPWTVAGGNNGQAMKSGNAGVASSTSEISLTFDYPTDGTFSFDAECMGEGSSTIWDKCTFSIDGQQQFQYGANMAGWHNYSYQIAAGSHTFTWSYSKDSSVNPTGDYFMVDNVTISYEGGGDTNDDPVTPIVWSNILPKDMNAEVTVNAHVSGGTPVGVNVEFVNTFDGTTYTAELDETGTIVFDEFTKGDYTLSVTLPDFSTTYDQTAVSIWSDTVFDAYLTEVFYPVNEIVVSGTGYARWTNMLPDPERVAQRYHVVMNDIFQGETTDNFMQLNVDNLEVGQECTAAVAVIYSTGMSSFKTTTFTYLGCEATATQVEDLDGYSACTDVILTWNGGSNPNPGPNPGNTEVYDFENSTMQGWTSIDADGDSYGWEMGSAPVSYLVAGASLAGTGHNSSNDMVISGSYSNNVGVLTPDNYLVSPSKGVYSGVSFWACGQDASYVAEHFGVAVSTGNATPNNFTMVQEWTMTTKDAGTLSIGRNGQMRAQGSWHEYTVDLSAYAGQEIWIAIRHFNCSDMFILDVDDITLTGEGGNPNPGPTPPPTGNTFNFDDGTMQGWTSIDADGDSYGWEMGSAPVSYLVAGASLAGTGHNSSADLVISGSYSNNVGVLTPDNYLVSPSKAAYTGISFWACGQDASYVAEHFGVAVSTGNSVNDFVMIQEWTMTAKDAGVLSIGRGGESKAQGSWHEYTVDLSAYAGQDIWVAIRHFNCTDMFILDVDDITLGAPTKGAAHAEACGTAIQTNETPREMWDLVTSFNAAEAAQYGVASDGQNIYTCNWGYSSATYNFYKYDLQGNMIEGFNVPGCGTIRDLTYDGQYFYGGANASVLYCIDLANHTLVSQTSTTCSGIRHCSYDPVNDGFWVGGWSDLKLIDRTGATIQNGPAVESVSGSGYFTAEDGSAHLYLFCQPNSDAKVYDFNISTNSVGAMLFDFASTPGFDPTNGMSGGAFIGNYNGMTCFFGDVQQSPNLIGIYELGAASGPSGTTTTAITPNKYNIFKDGEVIGATSDTYFVYEAEDTDEHYYEVYFVDANYNFSCAVDGVTVAAGTIEDISSLDYEFNDPELTLTWEGPDYTYVIYEGIVDVNTGNVELEAIGETTEHTFTIESIGDEAGYYLFLVQSVVGDCASDLQTLIDNQLYVLLNYDDVNETEIVNAIYPNPTSGDLHINAIGMTRVRVLNALGQMIYDAEVDTDEMILNMGQFDAGIYMVNIVTVNGSTVKRIVVTK